MKNLSAQIGDRIRQYRKHMGLSQEELAFNSGINVSFLGFVERGIKKPSIETLEKILGALGVTFQEFFDFEIDIKPLKDRTALEKLYVELQNRSDDEIEMAYDLIKRVLVFSDKRK